MASPDDDEDEDMPVSRSSFADVAKMVQLAVKSLNIACFWATNGLWHMRHQRLDNVSG